MEKISRFIYVPECGLEIDLYTATVRINDEEVSVGMRVYKVIIYLSENPRRVHSTENIVKNCGFTNAASCWNEMSRIRRKFDHKMVFANGYNGYSLLENKIPT